MQTFDEFMDEHAAVYLRNVLKENDWVVSKAARAAGRHRTDFYKVLRRYGIQYRPRKRKFGSWEKPIPENW